MVAARRERTILQTVVNFPELLDEFHEEIERLPLLSARYRTLRDALLAADVGDSAQCAALVHQAEELFGQVDILVSNAGIGQPHKIVDTPDEEWERVMHVNARATLVLARQLLPGMIERQFGRFVSIS